MKKDQANKMNVERVYRWRPLVWEPGLNGSSIDPWLVREWHHGQLIKWTLIARVFVDLFRGLKGLFPLYMFDYLTIQFIQSLKVNPDQLDLIGWQVCRSFLVSNWLKISCISLTMQPIQFNSVAPPNIPEIDLIRWQVCRSFLPSNWPKISCICLTIPTPWHRLSCSVVRQSHRCANPITICQQSMYK